MLSLAKFIKKEIELRENLVGTGFMIPPKVQVERAAQQLIDRHMEDMNHRVVVSGEIVSTTGFQAPATYIMYQLLLPEQGWVYEDFNDYDLNEAQAEENLDFNKRSSITQISHGVVELADDPEDEDTTKFTSNFCFPFDYQFLAKNTSCKFPS